MNDWIRLGGAGVLFALSLLVVTRAPLLPLFYLAVAVTEFGRFLAVPALLLAVIGFASTPAGWLGSGLALAAAGLFLSPMMRGWRFARRHGLPFTVRKGAIEERRLDFGAGRHADCFFQLGIKNAPLLVVVHGGGWEGGVTREGVESLEALARLGVFVASVSYGLVPEVVWPAQREDVRENIRDLCARAEELGFDAARIYLLGRSAGGQIASALACGDGVSGLRGCICLYTPFDMIFAYELGREDDLLRSPRLLRRYLGGSPDVAHENYLTASAYQLVEKGAPPFLLLHGTRDELVWVKQSQRFAERLQEKGVPVEYLELPWARHAFDYFPAGAGGRVTLSAIRRFIFQDGT